MGYRPRVRKHNFSTQNQTLRYGLFSADISLGWRVVRDVSYERGVQKVVAGVWREVHDDLGNLIGFQILRSHYVDQDLPSRRSPVTITSREMQIFAGTAFAAGKSRTAGLSEDLRNEYVNSMPAGRRQLEDDAERVEAKVRVYPQITGARQDILRVWPKK